jgi:phosphoglycolate phosphatase-like HAD superfamily hydrolase
MPTNVCIDVDLTLVDEAGELLPGVNEALLKLREADCRLTLWSAAGAEYARSVAMRHSLDRLFEGFAGKPDVAIDDEPESTRLQIVFGIGRDAERKEIAEKIVEISRR